MKRGEIYYIYPGHPVGAEIAKGRPAVIVSADWLNAAGPVVEVVFLTTQPKNDQLTHVIINATGRESTALCEQINTVSKQRLGSYCGTCTAEEMRAIDDALLSSLDMAWEECDAEDLEEAEETELQDAQKLSKGEQWLIEELGRVAAERDRYARMLDKLLGLSNERGGSI